MDLGQTLSAVATSGLTLARRGRPVLPGGRPGIRLVTRVKFVSLKPSPPTRVLAPHARTAAHGFSVGSSVDSHPGGAGP